MITTAITPALVNGAAELETTFRGLRPHRLPASVRTRFPDPQLLMAESQPSGVRLVFSTTAEQLEVVTHPTPVVYLGVDRPRGQLDLLVDGTLVHSDELTGGSSIEVDMSTGASRQVDGSSHSSVFPRLPAGPKVVEIWWQFREPRIQRCHAVGHLAGAIPRRTSSA